MTYADEHCTYEETYEPEHKYHFKGKCVNCKKPKIVSVPGPELFAYRQGKLIQDAFPKLSAGDRQFLMSGICSPCYDAIFAKLAEEDHI